MLSASDAARGSGVDFFSSNICEDHLIGDLLWRWQTPVYKHHGLVWGDLAMQPMADMSVSAYVARRVRWLRVRKWTVIMATLVEPGVEPLLCCFYFAFALTALPRVRDVLGISQTWPAVASCWLSAVAVWIAVDWFTYRKLHACQSVEADENTPAFARGTSRRGGVEARPFLSWLLAWAGREVLALPVWTWAVLLGTTVTWRGQRFAVRMDMSVVEIEDGAKASRTQNGATAPSRGKGRVE